MKIWSLTVVPLLLAAPAFSGPTPAVGSPMICHEFEIGSARSLPWRGGEVKYDRTRLAVDVAEVLKTETDLMVHMETLRRAVIYTKKDKELAWALLGERSLALLDQTAIGSKESAAWFDVAYLVACYRQAGIDIDYRAGVADRIDGYGYFKTALERARSENSAQIGTIEFAAALAAHPAMFSNGGDGAVQERYRKHLEAARRSAEPGSLLEKNLTAHVSSWKGHFGL